MNMLIAKLTYRKSLNAWFAILLLQALDSKFNQVLKKYKFVPK